MRTSKVSQDTTKIFDALSPNRVRRSTRKAAKTISAFALGHDGSVDVKSQDAEESSSFDSAPQTNISTDIEDSLTTIANPSRKRKRGTDSTTTTTTISSKTRNSSRRRVKADTSKTNNDASTTTTSSSSPGKTRTKALPKIPARKTTLSDGTVQIQPPSNWSTIYDLIKTQRQSNPTAPVDTMGCEDLYWRSSSPREQRYHTLTALMLSSQTKDTVTAAAMQRLHTELVPQAQPQPQSSKPANSTLTIANILSAPPQHLNRLIHPVGFHNVKTKHIQLTAALLQQRHRSDVPRTLAELLALPGVGPKMAYLCLSAAWGVDAGIGVDVHVHRITNRWGWHATRTPEESRRCLEAWLPRDRWHDINRLLVGLGQTVCLPLARRCGECALAGTGLCKAEVKGWQAKEMKKRRGRRKESAGWLKVEVEVDVEGEGEAEGGDGTTMVEKEGKEAMGTGEKEEEMLEVKEEEDQVEERIEG